MTFYPPVCGQTLVQYSGMLVTSQAIHKVYDRTFFSEIDCL